MTSPPPRRPVGRPPLLGRVKTTYAIVDTDGMRLIVWGMGPTTQDARFDAQGQEGYEETEHNRVVKLTPDQVSDVVNGNVAWSADERDGST